MPAIITENGTLLFPLTPILEVGGIPFTVDSAGYTLSVLDADRREIAARVDTRRSTVTRGSIVQQVDSGAMLPAEGDVYLTAEVLAALLFAEVRSDFAMLELRVDPHVPFPAHLMIELDQRRQLAMMRTAHLARPPLPRTPLLPLSGAGVLHYSLSSALPEPERAAVAMLEAGFGVFGGLAAVGYTYSDETVDVDPRFTFRYERFIPERRWISFVRAGDVTTDGAFLRSIRGLVVTNRPYRRDRYFQDIVIDPEVPAGYEVEVYESGQLVAYSDRASGPLQVPLDYGRTDLEVRMIAPSGEVVTTQLLYGVPQSQLRESAFEYSTGAGACHGTRCATAFAVGDYGWTRWLTVGAGYEAARDTSGTDHLPFARASFAPAGGWFGETRVVGDQQLSAFVLYNGITGTTGSVGIDVRSASVPRATALPQERTRVDVRADVGVHGHRAIARVGGMEGTGIDRWALGWIASIPRGLVSVQVEDFAASPTGLDVTAYRYLGPRLFGGAVTASARLGASRHGMTSAEGGASASWSNVFFGNLTVGWDRRAGPNLALSFSRLLDVGQLAGVFNASESGGSRAHLRGDGSVAFDGVADAMPAAYTGIGFAGVDALAYRDADLDGVRDPDEPAAVGVEVRVGHHTATTDSSGHARVWGVLPWERTVVAASSEWFEPQWAPADKEIVLRPVPHVFNPVTIRLVATREFIAYVVPGIGVRTSAGIGFRLVEESTGVVREGLTLSDGSIYVSGLPAGSYSLELSAEDLAFLRVVPVPPIRFTVAGDGGDDFVFELPSITLERAPS